MHGAAVSSIAVGRTCGVAPDAKLYYWAINPNKDPTQKAEQYTDDMIAFEHGFAAAVDRMLEINDKLPPNEKIRVLSISRGFNDLNDPGVKTFLEAIERAKAAGIFVLTTSTNLYYDFIDERNDFGGLGKEDYYGDPDELPTYTLGLFEQFNPEYFADRLLAPMDARTTADFTGPESYVFYSEGGLSWVAPYLAGLYALAVQVDPDVTPQEFWSAALETSSSMIVKIHSAKTVADATEGNSYTLTHVIDPRSLIKALQSN